MNEFFRFYIESKFFSKGMDGAGDLLRRLFAANLGTIPGTIYGPQNTPPPPGTLNTVTMHLKIQLKLCLRECRAPIKGFFFIVCLLSFVVVF